MSAHISHNVSLDPHYGVWKGGELVAPEGGLCREVVGFTINKVHTV